MRTPNLDRVAASGTRFGNAYTPCPICIPARAALATGHYVHRIGYWDNGIPYDGRVRGWHHELRDHGFREEIEPLHVVDGEGDVLGCIRDDAPRRHKRGGIEEAGPGDSIYIRYDRDNADRANDASPWVLQVGFVLPHPPYIAPPELYDSYPLATVALPPQWREDEWPRHPAMEHFRWFFDFDRPFGEQRIRELVAAYYGAVASLASWASSAWPRTRS